MSNFPRCCFCQKPLRTGRVYEVVLEDDDHRHVMVGPDCFKRVAKAGADGARSGHGLGPMVFATTAMAQAYAKKIKTPNC
jgi:hypothetical protein